MKCVRLSVQTLPGLSSEIFEVWVTTDICPDVISLHLLSYDMYLSAASATTKNTFDSILDVPAARVMLFSEGLLCSIGKYNNHLSPKKTVTCRVPATSYCYSLEHSTLVGCTRSELQKGGSELAAHKARLSSTRGQSEAENPTQESQHNVCAPSFPKAELWQIFLMGAAFQPLTRQASETRASWEGERLQLYWKKYIVVAWLNKKLCFRFWANTNGSLRS